MYFGWLGPITAAEIGDLAALLVHARLRIEDERRAGDARDGKEGFGIGITDELVLVVIGFELDAIGVGLIKVGIEVLEGIDDDVLALLSERALCSSR